MNSLTLGTLVVPKIINTDRIVSLWEAVGELMRWHHPSALPPQEYQEGQRLA
jgi:hypothetical protein